MNADLTHLGKERTSQKLFQPTDKSSRYLWQQTCSEFPQITGIMLVERSTCVIRMPLSLQCGQIFVETFRNCICRNAQFVWRMAVVCSEFGCGIGTSRRLDRAHGLQFLNV